MLNNSAAPEETTMLTRRTAAKSLAFGLPFLSASAHAATGKAPGADWEKATPKEVGFRPDGFEALELKLCTLPTTSFMVVTRRQGDLQLRRPGAGLLSRLGAQEHPVDALRQVRAERHDRPRQDDGRSRHRRGRRPAADREDRQGARPADRELGRLSSGRQPGRRSQHGSSTEVAAIAERCDGVRCDMAMLVLDDIFVRTWGARAAGGRRPTVVVATGRR